MAIFNFDERDIVLQIHKCEIDDKLLASQIAAIIHLLNIL